MNDPELSVIIAGAVVGGLLTWMVMRKTNASVAAKEAAQAAKQALEASAAAKEAVSATHLLTGTLQHN